MKKCPFCAEQIQDDAIKCRFCNSPLGQGAAGQPAVATALNPNAAVGATPVAVPIFGGTPSWKAWFWGYLGAALVGVLGVVGAVGMIVKGYEAKTALMAGGGGVVLALGWLGYLEMRRRSVNYRVTTRTIDVDVGFFSKRIDTLQLWKVRDIEFNQSFVERVMNVGSIKILSHDETSPVLILQGVPDSRAMFDRLKGAIEQARQSARNVVDVVGT